MQSMAFWKATDRSTSKMENVFGGFIFYVAIGLVLANTLAATTDSLTTMRRIQRCGETVNTVKSFQTSDFLMCLSYSARPKLQVFPAPLE